MYVDHELTLCYTVCAPKVAIISHLIWAMFSQSVTHLDESTERSLKGGPFAKPATAVSVSHSRRTDTGLYTVVDNLPKEKYG